MRVITINLNGIRSACKKGFFTWLRRQRADIVCLQELRAHEDQIQDKLFWPPYFHCYYHPAQKKGYSGVGIYCKKKPDYVIKGLGLNKFDVEGRWIEARYENLSIVSLYLPSGSSDIKRQKLKMDLLDKLEFFLSQIKNDRRQYIICGDFNIAHKKIDIKNWRGNQKSPGFLPEERNWMDNLIDREKWIDAFREINKDENQYTWWSNRGKAWEKNVGWRIDYQIISPRFSKKIKRVNIYKEKRFSDHSPLIIDYYD